MPGTKPQFCACKRANKPGSPGTSELIQEQAGFHVGISAGLGSTARHAASLFQENYDNWMRGALYDADSEYKNRYFTVAVGGGNTVKAEYRALLENHYGSMDWIEHVRFFFLEESSGEKNWESSRHGLIENFIVPLARKLIGKKGRRAMAAALNLELPVDEDDIIEHMTETMLNSIVLTEVKTALNNKNPALAKKLARRERDRYQRNIRSKLGRSMAFHVIISGIGKDGSVGALTPYTPELKNKQPGAVVLEQDNGALRVALSRGVLVNAGCISLIVSGNLKLKALGRFEMEEAADFEQTVIETPLRMLRETRKIAEKVYIFANERALHLDETVFKYTENGISMENRAEKREGEEEGGIHLLLMHGFMGLYSFTNLLLRMPSAWTVLALHRGSHAKTLPDDEIFPHYAGSLRKAILKNWRQGRPTPIGGHSIAGVIMDHLLLSIIGDYDGPIPPYSELKREDQQLVDALRAGGIIQLAGWAPTDGPHTGQNIKSLVSHIRHKTRLDYSGFKRVYVSGFEHELQPHEWNAPDDSDRLAFLDDFLKMRGAESIVNTLNMVTRYLLKNRKVQQKMLNADSPYVMRVVGGRLLKKISFFGLFKEVNAALHNTTEYQRRHLKALDIILEYDIPLLSIVHQDDFLVSAIRHREEHEYLVSRRLVKEGVTREQDLSITARYVMLERDQEELPLDALNPHLMFMSNSHEGTTMARQITAAVTRFVNENVARAIESGDVRPLASVGKWPDKNRPARRGRKTQVA